MSAAEDNLLTTAFLLVGCDADDDDDDILIEKIFEARAVLVVESNAFWILLTKTMRLVYICIKSHQYLILTVDDKQ